MIAFPVPITCSSAGLPTWAQGAYTSAGTIELRPWACVAIADAKAGRLEGRVAVEVAGVAVWLLAHEYAHATLGVLDRNVTAGGEDSRPADCAGWHLIPKVGRLLNLAPRLIDRLAGVVAPAALEECS